MNIPVYNIEGKETGRNVTLDKAVFGLENPSDHLIYMDIRLIRNNQRQGTSKAKERGEVSGSNKKPYRQKGTGNARPGHKRSPLWRHGGTTFGPRPRDYGFHLNKKQKRIARRSALTYKAKDDGIRIIENFTFEVPKTKQFLEILNNFELSGKKVLLVLGENDKNVYLSGRNLPKASVCTAQDLNTYDILNADQLLITEDAVSAINERLN
ncbi:MAG: 50S ribosomal protein L4 [Bacteroidota bacterium]